MDIIVKDGIVIYATFNDIQLPSDGVSMIEFEPNGMAEEIRVGGGDIHSDNSIIYKDIILPLDFKSGKYLYDGSDFTLNPAFLEIED